MAKIGNDTTIAFESTAIGRVETGELSLDQSLVHLTGAGGNDSVVYSLAEPKGNADMWVTSIAFLSRALKTVVNALPPVITVIEGGVLGSRMNKQTSCYIDTLEMSLQKGGAVKAKVDWLALTHTVGTITVGPANPAKNLVMAWNSACVTLGSQAFNCQSVTTKLVNGLKLDTDLDCKTAGVERMPTVVLPGNSKITCDVEFDAYPTVDIGVAAPATITLAWTAKSTEGSPKTLTVQVTDLHPIGVPVPIVAGETKVTYKLSLETDYNMLTALTMTLA